MKLRAIFEKVNDHNLDVQERLFRLLTMVGVTGFAIGTVGGIIEGESLANIYAMAAALVVCCLLVGIILKTRRIQLGAVVIGFLIIFFVLPYNFITSGGVYGGAPIWFVFGLMYVCLVIRGKIKYVFLGFGFVSFALCYYLQYTDPSMITEHSTQKVFTDSIMSLAIVSSLMCCMILFQNAIYQTENELAKKQKDEIEELNRAQNRFFSSMSHEIRTPINTIIGLNEMILREDVSDEVAADARYIQGASNMLLTLINDILDMSKMEAGKMDIVPAEYDVGSALSDVVNMIWVRAQEKGLKFHVDVDSSMPARLFGDEVRIKQILINVLNNAVKYTPEGSVTLSIQCGERYNDKVNVMYSIADTGIGIKKESIPHLFSAFKRVDEEKNKYVEGTGLGLSIVKQLVDLMGGNISVNSVYTKGSTFVITIPQVILSDDKVGNVDLETRFATRGREHYRQSFEASKAKLLIVDDNETNLMVAEKLLHDTKIKIETVTSGKECLSKTLQTHYDVIFMDHLMPEMDGIECLHALRDQTGGLNTKTPVIILTANAGEKNKRMYSNEGFDGYLLKPVRGIQLEEELLKHLPRELVTFMGFAEGVGVVETGGSPVFVQNAKLPIRISTDSVSDLPSGITSRYQISVMPYRVKTPGGEFLDEIEVETDGLLEYMENSDKVAASEAPVADDYVQYFAELLESSQYVIHISMAQYSGNGYANASEAAKTFDNVFVVDSGHLSSGMGLLVIEAARYAESGMTAMEVVQQLKETRKKVKTSFILDDTRYLMRSGRISAKISAICDALMLHPVIVLKNSKMKVGGIRFGTKKTVRMKYIRSALDVVSMIDRRMLFITYAGLTAEEIKWIEEEVEKKEKFENIICQKASPAISTNCGPGCFGVLFMTK